MKSRVGATWGLSGSRAGPRSIVIVRSGWIVTLASSPHASRATDRARAICAFVTPGLRGDLQSILSRLINGGWSTPIDALLSAAIDAPSRLEYRTER
jgi:hypothetical protein